MQNSLLSNPKLKGLIISENECEANKNSAGQAPEGDWTTLAAPMCNGGLES